MKQSLLTLIWTSCKRNVLMTIGMSIRAETCQIRGKVLTKFTLLKEKPPMGYLLAGRRLTKVQTTTGPDHVCPEVMTKIGKAAQNQEKQEWKLDNARRLRGIYFVEPDDQAHKETLKHARRKLERPTAAAMPCKKLGLAPRRWLRSRKLHPKIFPKTIYGCIVESHESTRQRVESSLLTIYEDRIAGKDFTSTTHYNLVLIFIPMPHAMRIPDAKAAVDKEWKKLETIPAWDLEKSRARRRLFSKQKKVHFATLMDICHLKNAE